MGKYRWSGVEKAYAGCMYLPEALTVLCLTLHFLSRDVFIGVVSVVLAVCSASFHLMLQNLSLHRMLMEQLKTLVNLGNVKPNPSSKGDCGDG